MPYTPTPRIHIALLVRSDALNSFTSHIANLTVEMPMPLISHPAAHAKDMKSSSSGKLTVAHAHNMLARPYALNSFTSHSAAPAKDMKGFVSEYLTLVSAHVHLVSSYARNSFTSNFHKGHEELLVQRVTVANAQPFWRGPTH